MGQTSSSVQISPFQKCVETSFPPFQKCVETPFPPASRRGAGASDDRITNYQHAQANTRVYEFTSSAPEPADPLKTTQTRVV